MAYSAKAIANYFLDLAERERKLIDPMMIQKLVYLAHGWYLAMTGEPLIKEPVEAWRYGPVIRELYKSFARFGNSPITSPATEPEHWIREGAFRVGYRAPSINANADLTKNEEAKDLLNQVWNVYGKFTGIQLSNLTHEAGSPWDTANKLGTKIIDNETIKSYFEQKNADAKHHANA